MNHDTLRELGQQLRVDSVRIADSAGSGHPTSSLSAADLMAVLLAEHLRYDFSHPDDPAGDHLVFSKGHASPLLYAMYRAAGAIDGDELDTYRQKGSRLEGHPTPRLPWVDVATGSLGQGLPLGVGLALACRNLDRLPNRIWVLCGDSEMAEGSMYEALEHAGVAQLANLTAIIDVNRLGQTRPTMHEWKLDAYSRRARTLGWHSIEIDGHDVAAIDEAYSEAQASDKPTAIVARTVKGKGVPEVADRNGFHGKAVPDAQQAIAELGGPRDVRVEVRPPEFEGKPHRFPSGEASRPRWDVGAEVATRSAYGATLAALGTARGDVVALDGEVSNSTKSEAFAEAHPERWFEMFIAEQQMIAAAVGMQVRGWVPFASTFAAFHARSYDFVRMAAISRADLRLCGSHAGVEIGEDGPSQMGLEDIAMFRAIHGSTVLYPCDANQTATLVDAMADRSGISYLRTTRGETPVIYAADEAFPIGGSKILRRSQQDEATVVAAGVTLHEALTAADDLADRGIAVRVIDAYSVKPLDVATLREAAAETGRLIVAEDHWAEGGLGEAVAGALATEDVAATIRHLAVRQMPASATPGEQLAKQGLDAEGIAAAVEGAVRS